MATLSVRIPHSLHDQIRELARREGVSINQLILTAVAEKASSLRTARYLELLDRPFDRQEFNRALAQVPDAEPDPWDRLENVATKGSR
ncbi:MAG: toxin-antitoxin system HicB family antitoxin [Thermoanaerobaculia bacterium]|nr:toxin-antitoxin system HicB family antitoxin [Thermoanaerobaculia bacterium]